VESYEEFLEREEREILIRLGLRDFSKKLILLMRILKSAETEILSFSSKESYEPLYSKPTLEFRLRLAFRPEGTTPEDSTEREGSEEEDVRSSKT